MESKQVTKELLLDCVGDFTWNFGCNFFIETEYGNFIWSDPEYGGNNTMRKTLILLQDYFYPNYGRDKGKHLISEYCGAEWELCI